MKSCDGLMQWMFSDSSYSLTQSTPFYPQFISFLKPLFFDSYPLLWSSTVNFFRQRLLDHRPHLPPTGLNNWPIFHVLYIVIWVFRCHRFLRRSGATTSDGESAFQFIYLFIFIIICIYIYTLNFLLMFKPIYLYSWCKQVDFVIGLD